MRFAEERETGVKLNGLYKSVSIWELADLSCKLHGTIYCLSKDTVRRYRYSKFFLTFMKYASLEAKLQESR